MPYQYQKKQTNKTAKDHRGEQTLDSEGLVLHWKQPALYLLETG